MRIQLHCTALALLRQLAKEVHHRRRLLSTAVHAATAEVRGDDDLLTDVSRSPDAAGSWEPGRSSSQAGTAA